MPTQIPRGVYPVMITPFTSDNRIDFDAVDRIVDYYASCGCQGIFAVCQSSEMFFLSLEEREALARRVVQANRGRMCIVASGHVSEEPEDQAEELRRVRDAGVDAVVMVSNRFGTADEEDAVLMERLDWLMRQIPDIPLGMYECPHPYKRPLSPSLLEMMAESGRFAFIKDTCGDAELISRRMRILAGRVQLFNANSVTLLDTLRSGCDGFSGIMANMHPDLYVYLCAHFRDEPEKGRLLSDFLTVACQATGGIYPTCAKYHMNLMGIPMEITSRMTGLERWDDEAMRVTDSMLALEREIRKTLSN